MAKTYYDGEDREIVSITHYIYSNNEDWWLIRYGRGDSAGVLVVPATDELDALRKFPETLADLSKNDDREF